MRYLYISITTIRLYSYNSYNLTLGSGLSCNMAM